MPIGKVFSVHGSPETFSGLKQAKNSGMWESAWLPALRKDLKNGQDSKAWKLVPKSRIKEAQLQYGAHMVDVMYLVTQFKVKRDASGNITKYKARTCVADIKRLGEVRGQLQSGGGVFFEAYAGSVAGGVERSHE